MLGSEAVTNSSSNAAGTEIASEYKYIVDRATYQRGNKQN